jgi:hypothetical protein
LELSKGKVMVNCRCLPGADLIFSLPPLGLNSDFDHSHPDTLGQRLSPRRCSRKARLENQTHQLPLAHASPALDAFETGDCLLATCGWFSLLIPPTVIHITQHEVFLIRFGLRVIVPWEFYPGFLFPLWSQCHGPPVTDKLAYYFFGDLPVLLGDMGRVKFP